MCGNIHHLGSNENTKGACASINDKEEEFNWTIEQKLSEEDQTTDKTSLNNTVYYGFANQYSCVLAKLQVLFL